MLFNRFQFVLVLGSLLIASQCLAETAGSEVAFDASKPGQVAIRIGEQTVASYFYQDKEIPRPYFAHIETLAGQQVTRTHPPVKGVDRADHPTFHPGLWMAFGDISGNDYWRLKAKVAQASLQVDQQNHSFTVHNRYHAQEDSSKTVCEERCTYSVQVRPSGYLLTWDSSFSAEEPFYFGDQEEMGIGFRVATPLRAEGKTKDGVPAGTGRMTDANGRVNGTEIWGKAASWCDFSGTLDGQHVGMTLFCHPKNFRPSWFHARDYGLLLANPFGRQAFGQGEPSRVEVKPGKQLRLRYGVLVHSSPAGESPDLDAEFAGYLQASKE